MFNTAKPNEIDEVMSSVRKLVTRADRTPDGAPPGDTAQASERLILTPALRVDGTDGKPASVPETSGNVLVLGAGTQPVAEPPKAIDIGLEAVVVSQAEDWEPEEGESFDETDWAESAFAASEASVVFESTGDAPDTETEDPETAPEDALAAFLPDQSVPDSDALRAMIVQIVREELSGETGERITRSVRKLVRHEIRQALAAQDIG